MARMGGKKITIKAYDIVIDEFAAEMKARMRDAEIKGRTGWDSINHLGQFRIGLMNNAIQCIGGQPQEADVANFAMMLWHIRRSLS